MCASHLAHIKKIYNNIHSILVYTITLLVFFHKNCENYCLTNTYLHFLF